MTIGSALFANWSLSNLDKDGELEGDFEAQNITRNISVSYADHFTLSRENPITQFTHGNVDTLSFEGRFFVDPAILSLTGLPFNALSLLPQEVDAGRFSLRPAEKLAILETWASVDPDLGRPPIVLFAVGDGELSQRAVIESISNIVYDRPLITGEVRGVTFTLNLRKFVAFDIETASEPPSESRAHHTKEREYYELVAEREYGAPLMGDIVRKRNPDKGILQTGDVVTFPSLAAIQSIQVIPRSIPLQGLTENVESPQRTLRQLVQDRLNLVRFSTIIPDGV